jgi:glucose-1-phosphate thymidylyltransferase
MVLLDCIILAGGFARRLLPLTENTPKPLLHVGGKPILAYTTEKLKTLGGLGKVYITTNGRFKDHFAGFIERDCKGLDVELFVEDAQSEKQKLGSVGAMDYLVSARGLHSDTLVIGGDNIFDFELKEFVDHQRMKKAPVIALHDVKSKDKASLYGIASMDHSGRIVSFVEKPKEPPSTTASTACYIFTAEAIGSLSRYIKDGNPPDAAGHFVAWLCNEMPVYGFVFEGAWFDIGSKESLAEADRLYTERNGSRGK